MIEYISLPFKLTAIEIFNQIRELGDAVLLDSCQPDSQFGRYDIIAAAPDRKLRVNDQGTWTRETASADWTLTQREPFSILNAWLAELKTPSDLNGPFNTGLIGSFSYDLGRHLETLPSIAKADIAYPDLEIGRYLWAVVIDHHQQHSHLVFHSEWVDRQEIERLVERLTNPTASPTRQAFKLNAPFASNLSAEDYASALNKVDEYIHAGDVYQINFAQRFQSSFEGDPWQAWTALKRIAPTPYAAYLENDQGAVLSLSPERFLWCNAQGEVETRPIKGTRPRHSDPNLDLALQEELSHSEKDRAENLMIVDLLRNDLSKVCQPDSVKVPELFSLETYPNVHHLVSSITGTLDTPHTPLDLLKHSFPGGSITGAPKIRAMEIIDELEPHRRSIYCGSIAYISACGHMNSSITIRTLLCERQQIYCWAGGGIVADSDIASEYQETFNKVNNLLQNLEEHFLGS
ncbi:aminodeoxychorismate synthase component I [Nitrincola nitratireducens]|uniref:aminodeoxychorismate synthase n=1 Tax=Nitrincola nitratireducens TaxID=1229521 RepID=W9US70_9GAMM|nr:aminodeoxychorismate synthase component I [Nitrincola nitratireducens]EXJ09924.1 Para-aminobenzoate synthase component 1 [Nitrincola nitratireducens]